jgi:hypothetical protein
MTAFALHLLTGERILQFVMFAAFWAVKLDGHRRIPSRRGANLWKR